MEIAKARDLRDSGMTSVLLGGMLIGSAVFGHYAMWDTYADQQERIEHCQLQTGGNPYTYDDCMCGERRPSEIGEDTLAGFGAAGIAGGLVAFGAGLRGGRRVEFGKQDALL